MLKLLLVHIAEVSDTEFPRSMNTATGELERDT